MEACCNGVVMHKYVYMSKNSLILRAAVHVLIVCHLQSSSVTADTTILLIWPSDSTVKPFTLIAAL